MKATLFALASLASVALAMPAPQASYHGSCLSQEAAETLVDRYIAVISQTDSDLGDPVTTAKKIIAKSFQESSDSANTQLGLPLGAVTVPSKAAFIQGSQEQRPLLPDTLGVFVACNYITWQWVAPVTDTRPFPIKGFHLFEVNANKKLTETWFEFDVVAAAIDDGWTVIDPEGNEVVLTIA